MRRTIEEVIGSVESADTQFSGRLGVLLGDSVNSLRLSLDYFVSELAELDSGIERHRTQFPVEQSQEAFRGRRQAFLNGVSDRMLQIASACRLTTALPGHPRLLG